MSDKKLPMLGGPKLIGQPPKHVQLMLEEADILAQRVLAMDQFMDTPQFDAVTELDRHLLHAQNSAMQAYLRILLVRINRTKPKMDS